MQYYGDETFEEATIVKKSRHGWFISFIGCVSCPALVREGGTRRVQLVREGGTARHCRVPGGAAREQLAEPKRLPAPRVRLVRGEGRGVSD